MANEFIAQLQPSDFYRESALGFDSSMFLTQVGDVGGLTFPKLADQGYTAVVPVSHANTFTTGLTFTLYTVDDGRDSSDLGKVVRFGLTVKRLIDGESIDLDTGAATETTADVTLESTAGNVTVNTAAIANAALDSLATGEAFLFRLRRVGSHANDTCNGRVIVMGVGIKNT